MRAALAPCLALLLASACGGPGATEVPNVVLLIGDDHGHPDYGFMGSEIARTPHLDRLAEEGTVFRVGFDTASYCQPSLRTLLTGLEPAGYELRQQLLTRARGSYEILLPHLDTLPRALGRAGYASFQAGKYHEGSPEWAGFTAFMPNRGGPLGVKLGRGLVRNTMEPVFEFIDAPRDGPFFLWFAPAIPHLPHDAPERFRAPYESLDLTEEERGYLASVSWFDWSVGELVRHLEERGLRERTLLVYLADNGWDPRPPEGRADSWLGGPKGKRSLYELGFRTPILFSWPGHVPEGVAREDLVSTVDVVPTLLDYAGAPPIGGLPGRSLRPRIEGAPAPEGAAIAGWMDGVAGDPKTGPRGGFFLRTDRWYYFFFNRGGERLFDVRADPRQEHDVAAAHPQVVQRARARIERWYQGVRRSAEAGARELLAAQGS